MKIRQQLPQMSWLRSSYLSNDLDFSSLSRCSSLPHTSINNASIIAKLSWRRQLSSFAITVYCHLHLGATLSVLSICNQTWLEQISRHPTQCIVLTTIKRHIQKEIQQNQSTRRKRQSNPPWSILRHIPSPCHLRLRTRHTPSTQSPLGIQPRQTLHPIHTLHPQHFHMPMDASPSSTNQHRIPLLPPLRFMSCYTPISTTGRSRYGTSSCTVCNLQCHQWYLWHHGFSIWMAHSWWG